MDTIELKGTNRNYVETTGINWAVLGKLAGMITLSINVTFFI